ncbi:SCO2521 family protein [Streptomyces sp. NPDC093094]|uniref:SCO2521 family protein n=1 Tax=Streptomyces sp. NPDC093094 TaxID=3366026 RepID=UPI0037F3AFEC
MTTAPGRPAQPVLACGEVRTCLLPSSRALDGRAAARLLRLRADEPVLVSERPVMYARSPEVLTGVDCRLPTSNGAAVRAVGTVVARAALTEGRVLQAGAYFGAPATGPETRRPWGHHLARPGEVEPVGKLPEQVTAEGVLRGPGRGELDLGTIAESPLTQVMHHPLLDRKVPLKSRRTDLRWVARRGPADEKPSLERFTLGEGGLRTVELRLPQAVPAAAAAGLCEDLALHDWLLTTVVHLVDKGGPALPAVEHLLHLWMPRSHVDPVLSPLWDVLEHSPGFSRQWQNLVQRIRDQLAVRTARLLQQRPDTTAGPAQ